MRPIVCILMTVIGAASGSGSQRVRFGPGVCGPIDPVYIKVTTETGGQPFPMSTAEVGKSSRAMEASFLPEMILWASGDSENSYSISVDPTVERVMFSGTFDTRGGSLTLVAPDGTVTQQGDRIEDTPLNCGRIVTVDAPASGTWQVRMIPTDRAVLAPGTCEERPVADGRRVRGTRRRGGIRPPRQNPGPADCGQARDAARLPVGWDQESDVSARIGGRATTSCTRSAVHG